MTSEKSPDSDVCYTPPSSGSDGPPDYQDDDQDGQGPPRLAPVSGVLGQKTKAVIRPIAFKPVPPPSSLPLFQSQSSRLLGASPYSSESDPPSSGSYGLGHLLGDDRSLTYSLDSCLKLSRDDFPATPSPSDSGVAELEALLREKESEICHLRETLEHNEQVIFKVYQEKEQAWQREIRRMREQHDGKLRICQQRLARAEHLLGVHTCQVQQERRRVQAELEEAHRQRQVAERQTEALRSRLEDTEWVLCQRAGEVAALKSQLKGEQGSGEQRHELERLHKELANTKHELELTRETIDDERTQWMEEKEKVIRYQKQLQMSYVQIYRRNRTLECEMQQLAVELEGKEGESHC